MFPRRAWEQESDLACLMASVTHTVTEVPGRCLIRGWGRCFKPAVYEFVSAGLRRYIRRVLISEGSRLKMIVVTMNQVL